MTLALRDADRGWSLILPDSRRAYASRDQYIALAESTDWSRFSWRFNDEGDYCEDGGIYCVVRLQIDQMEGIPQFLLNAPQSREDDLLRTLSLDDDPVSPGNAELIVYFYAWRFTWDFTGRRVILSVFTALPERPGKDASRLASQLRSRR